MKSFRDEIRLRRNIKTDLISSKQQGFDFIQTCLAFIVSKVNDFIIGAKIGTCLFLHIKIQHFIKMCNFRHVPFYICQNQFKRPFALASYIIFAISPRVKKSIAAVSSTDIIPSSIKISRASSQLKSA